MPFIERHHWTKEMIETHILAGMYSSQIADLYGVSKQRMTQLYKKFDLMPLQKSVEEKKKFEEHYGFALRHGNKVDSDLYRAQKQKFINKKAHAKRLGTEWNLNFGELYWPLTCPILGIELNYFAEKTEEGSVSFDRINPNRGYVKGNVQIISWRANRIKNDGSAEEHRKIAAYLYSLETSVVLL